MKQEKTLLASSMKSSTYYTFLDAPKSTGLRASGSQNSTICWLAWTGFLAPSSKLKLQIYHGKKNKPFVSALSTLSCGWMFPISYFYTSVFFTIMTTDPPSTPKCRAQMSWSRVFNNCEAQPIFSSHREVSPRLCNHTILITTTEFVETGHKQLFTTAQKSAQAAKSTQEIGQVLKGNSYSDLTTGLHNQHHNWVQAQLHCVHGNSRHCTVDMATVHGLHRTNWLTKC